MQGQCRCKIHDNTKILKKSQHNYKLSFFMTNETPSGVNQYHESDKLESHQTAKISFLPPLLSLFRQGQFKMVLARNRTEQCINPSLFCNFKIPQIPSLFTTSCSHKTIETPTHEVWLHLPCHFLHLYACAQSTQQQNITQD